MQRKVGLNRISNAGWAVIFIAGIILFYLVCAAAYRGTFRSYVPVTLTSDRSGLVMEIDAKVKIRGVPVGRVGEIVARNGRSALKLEIQQNALQYIPANVQAKIAATTAFGAKFVDLIPPENPSSRRLAAGAVLRSSNVTSEVNTIFEDVVELLQQVDPPKLNAVLTALAEGVRGQGEQIGEATTDLNQVLIALNARRDTITADFRAAARFGDTFNAAASDIVAILNNASTTSDTVVENKKEVDSLLMSAAGFGTSGSDLLAKSKDNLVSSINETQQLTSLIHKYNGEITCLLQGIPLLLDKIAPIFGQDNKSLNLDASLMLGNDMYNYPDNLPIGHAKGGYGGKAGACGGLPDPRTNAPVRVLVTNTGWGTGTDWRTNPGLGNPCVINYFPSGRAYPQEPFLRYCRGPQAPGGPSAGGDGSSLGDRGTFPPQGAALYGPGGVPNFPGVPPADYVGAPPEQANPDPGLLNPP